MPKESFPEPPLMKAVFTHLGYGIMILLGHILDFLRRLGLKSDPYGEALKTEVLAGVHACLICASYMRARACRPVQ